MTEPVRDDLQPGLQTYCQGAFGSWYGARIREVANLSTGWESEMYSFHLEHGPAEQRQCEDLILRIYPGDDAHGKSAREFHGMRRLHNAGYPVPRVLALEREDSPFGQPFVIMQRINGRMLWPLLFGSPREQQDELLTVFCELFVQLHALDWRPFVEDVARVDMADPYFFEDRWLEDGRRAIEELDMPGFLPIVDWLGARKDQVPCRRPSVVHQDFHPNNVLLRDDGSGVVIDWTQVDVADSRSDLAWTLVLVSSYRGSEWRERILREYERLAGGGVEQIEHFEVSACAKRLASVTASLLLGPEKLGMRPEAAATMKQQMGATRAVYEMLLERTGIRVAEVEKMLEPAP
jgi:aminoglycoside phosphotransferase (APT) family kinase protein